ncbi:MAG: L-2-hydroxyglutarate oxidase [Gemmatimonadota bacterium]
MSYRVAILGGGIVGLATARALVRAGVRDLIVLEKEAGIAMHQSTHNSGVLHAGLHYAPGSVKARLARTGIRAMTAYCVEHGITHEICGKLVVATSDDELPRLRALQDRGERNGLTGLRWLAPERARELEPHAYCIGALHVPEEGIVDYAGVCRSLAREVVEGEAVIRLDARVHGLRRNQNLWVVNTGAGDFEARLIINCAGLHVDRLSRLAGEKPASRIVPFRGEYFKLRPDRKHLVRNLIYPVPDPVFPFLGVHFTRLALGGIEAGPNAVLAFAREGYRKSDVALRDLMESLSFSGLWRFLAKHPRTVVLELARSFSKVLFLKALQRLLPELREEDLSAGGAGVRAQAMLPNGNLVHDFLWLEREGVIHVLSAPSPAATAALVIGEEIATRALRQLG